MSDLVRLWTGWVASEQAAESIALMCVMLASFGAGVAYAAYRAIGWETKLRRWAHGLDLDELLGVCDEEVNEREKTP